MPSYQYMCTECTNIDEQLVPVRDRDLERFCRCGGKMTRKISSPARVWAPTRSGKYV